MNEAQIADAVKRAAEVVLSDQCADGFHEYRAWFDGTLRCSCGAAHPDHLQRILASQLAEGEGS